MCERGVLINIREPHFVPVSALEGGEQEKDVNVRIDFDGNREVFQRINGEWVDVSDFRPMPTCFRDLASNTSSYWRFDGVRPRYP